MSPAQRLLRYLRPERGKMLLASLYSILNKLFDIAPEILIGVAVDIVVKREESFLAHLGIVDLRTQLFGLTALTIAIWACESLFQFLYQLEWRGLAQRVQHRIRLDGFANVLRVPMAELQQHRTGDLGTVLSEDVNQLERFLNDGINQILQTTVSTVVVSIIFFILAPEVAVFSVLPIPLILFLAFFFQRRLASRYAAVRAAGGEVGAQVFGYLEAIATLKAFTAEDDAEGAVSQKSEAYLETNREAIRWSSAFVPVIRMGVLSGFVVTLAYGGIRCLDGHLSVGAYSVLVFLTQRLLWPFTRLGETVDLYQRSMASAGRLLNLIELPIETRGGRSDAAFDSDIRFENIHFSYQPRQPTLRGIDVDIPAGKMTAFVGATGSGKSTLLKLLLRLYAPGEGRISLGGADLQEIDINALRKHIGWVGQQADVFYGSVADNLRLGRSDIDPALLEEVVQVAEFAPVIETLAAGMDSQVGERGDRLSGGQRQRLAIARALVGDPPILVMDEATSAVDNQTEAAIQRALKKAAAGRTTIVIAHRLSTVREADAIHVMRDGEIVESGTHETLLAKKGEYAGLWALQTGASLG